MKRQQIPYVLGLVACLCFGILIGHESVQAQRTEQLSPRATEEVNILWFDVVKKDANGLVGFRTFELDMNLAFANERVRLAERELALAREVQKSAVTTKEKNAPPIR